MRIGGHCRSKAISSKCVMVLGCNTEEIQSPSPSAGYSMLSFEIPAGKVVESKAGFDGASMDGARAAATGAGAIPGAEGAEAAGPTAAIGGGGVGMELKAIRSSSRK